MAKKATIVEYENVNGAPITLHIISTEKCKRNQFIITYDGIEKITYWLKNPMVLIIFYYILSMFFGNISLKNCGFIVITSFVFTFSLIYSAKSESLLVIPGVGIQTSAKFFVGSQNCFYAWDHIEDIFIQETLKSNRVIYYLAVVMKPKRGEKTKDIFILFRFTKPRLTLVERIYKELQAFRIGSLNAKGVAAGDT